MFSISHSSADRTGLQLFYLGTGHQSSPPGSIEEFHLGQSLGDHGGKHQAEEDTADQHVVVVVFQDIELFGRVDSGLVNVQTIGHDLQGRENGIDGREAARRGQDPQLFFLSHRATQDSAHQASGL